MSKAITAKERAQAVTGETLEQHVRGPVQALSQGLLGGVEGTAGSG